MATLSHFPPSLHVTTANDDMDISSQQGQPDHDIDLDIEIPSDIGGGMDNDLHLPDTVSEAGSAMHTHDQEMLQNPDNVMHDGEGHEATADAMDDQIDYVDEDIADANYEDVTDRVGTAITEAAAQDPPIIETNDADDVEFDDAFGAEEFREPDLDLEASALPVIDQSAEHPAINQSAEQPATDADLLAMAATATQVASEMPPMDAVDIVKPTTIEVTDASVHTETSIAAEDAEGEVLEFAADEFGPADDHAEETKLADTGEDVVAEKSDEPHDDQPAFHSIIVTYGESQFSLFPPAHQDQSSQYLLSDSSLASRSLADLLLGCRASLGDDIDDEEELSLYCADLEIEISEESAHVHSTSLAEILEVFLDLHRLDGVETPDPFEVVLEKKKRFSARLSKLRAAVADGRGMSLLAQGYTDGQTPLHAAGDTEDAPGMREHRASDAGEQAASDHKDSKEDYVEDPLTALHEAEGTTAAEADFEEPDAPDVGLTQHDVRDGDGDKASKPTEDPSDFDDTLDERPKENEEFDEEQTQEHTNAGDTGDHSNLKNEQEEEEELIDYLEDEPEEEGQSSDSSTIAGDASAAIEQEIEVAIDGHEDFQTADPSTMASGRSDEHSAPGEEPDDQAQEQPGDSAYIGEHSESAYDRAGENTLDGNHDDPELRDIDAGDYHHQHDDAHDQKWTEGAHADSAASDFDSIAAEGQPTQGNEDETWDDLFEEHEADDSNTDWTNGETTFEENFNLPANGDAQGDVHGQHGGLADNAFEEEDEITFDDDEDEYGLDGSDGHEEQPSGTDRPSDSPLGKRSFTEHLQGIDDEEGTDLGTAFDEIDYNPATDIYPEAKRLRST